MDGSYMRLTEKEDESLPIDVVLQTLLAFAVTCYGIVHIAGEFKDMDATSELKNKTIDTLRNHPSFYVFNHRGRPSDTTTIPLRIQQILQTRRHCPLTHH
ncbi:ER membrane protein complex subunit 5-like [Marmota marmota marmota]|uniref:ER membrane protein complex subunit 5-like n=1 Tax=Marmota marmota marmota TaxID=9994 RepID=UPI00148ED08E|nr:membrane magnesium transporter 1-like [Marmota flaviventris]XP_048662552.1 ER membrane protein complex subunit 5-like [Marmota marmota marmota]